MVDISIDEFLDEYWAYNELMDYYEQENDDVTVHKLFIKYLNLIETITYLFKLE